MNYGRKYLWPVAAMKGPVTWLMFIILLTVLGVFWFVSGFYMVKPAEEGVLACDLRSFYSAC